MWISERVFIVVQLNDIADSTERAQEFSRLSEKVLSSEHFRFVTNLEKLLPVYCRIVSDVITHTSQYSNDVKRELAASDAGVLWARTSKIIPLKFDQSFAFAELVRDFVSSELALEKTTYFTAFSIALCSEWQRLDALPYHKKLREANRFILQEKRRYYTIFNRMSEPAFIVDQDLHILETNKAFNDFFHLTNKEYIGNACEDVLGVEFCAKCSLENIHTQNSSFSGVETDVTVNGEHKYLVLRGTFLGDINSDSSGGIIIIQDVTQNKKAEIALQASEEKYRSLIENVPDVTWRADSDGNVTYLSPNFEKICGYPVNDICGSETCEKFVMVHPEDLDMVRNEFGLFFASHLPEGSFLRDLLRDSPEALNDERIVNGRKVYDVTYRLQRKDGGWIWVHDRASTIYEQDGNWYTDGVFSDVSELKEAEAELEKHHFRLAELVDERTVELRDVNKSLKKEIAFRKQAEKELLRLATKLKMSNQELEEFAHVASHDLKEPLMLIVAFGERLLKRYLNDLDEKGQEYLKRIITASNRMSQLVEGLLSLSRIATAEEKYEEVDLSCLFEEVIENLEERIRATGGSVELNVFGKLGGDKVQLIQLFQNILANALKFSKEGKTPVVKVTTFYLETGLCEISFQDNGIGFEACHCDRIFKPLERLHSRKDYEGTGMGLATCHKIVVRHGGEIEAKGEPGKGAVFIIRLPVSKVLDQQ